jgi:hypothetical protein
VTQAPLVIGGAADNHRNHLQDVGNPDSV